MNKVETIERIIACGVLPVIRAESADEARAIVEAVRKGGIPVIEIAMTVPGAVDLIAELTHSYNDLVIGAGTVLDVSTARKCVDAGAKFIVSPAQDFETIAFCLEKETPVMPGALTPTEVFRAWDAGADFVKIFPAGAMGGAGYLKSLKAPFPHIKMIPTGGVTLATAADLIYAGASAIGVGADLADVKAIRAGRSDLITQTAEKYVKCVDEARKHLLSGENADH